MNTNSQKSLKIALKKDGADPLKIYKSLFHYPINNLSKHRIYFCGNSLGLQPRTAKKEITRVLKKWAKTGVDGHFSGKIPWIDYHSTISETMANLVGALPKEVSLMNALTVNLHLALVSFYRPTEDRYKILMEYDAFPSDRYAVESMVRLRGLIPEETIIQINPDKNGLIDLDILKNTIEQTGSQLALVLLGNVNYYTGQLLPVNIISDWAHQVGAYIGWDLAHGVGNIPFDLHHDQVDFAVWCTYKYLNGGPGSLSGIFIHEKHGNDPLTPRLQGWWSQKIESRFDMRQPFDPEIGADGWIISNQSVLAIAPLKASMEIFAVAGITQIREKSIQLTQYLYELLEKLNSDHFKIITPNRKSERGCQLSLFFPQHGSPVFQKLIKAGVTVDFRKPDVIRVAPVPLYNSFEEVWRFVHILSGILGEIGK